MILTRHNLGAVRIDIFLTQETYDNDPGYLFTRVAARLPGFNPAPQRTIIAENGFHVEDLEYVRMETGLYLKQVASVAWARVFDLLDEKYNISKEMAKKLEEIDGEVV